MIRLLFHLSQNPALLAGVKLPQNLKIYTKASAYLGQDRAMEEMVNPSVKVFDIHFDCFAGQYGLWDCCFISGHGRNVIQRLLPHVYPIPRTNVIVGAYNITTPKRGYYLHTSNRRRLLLAPGRYSLCIVPLTVVETLP